MNTRPDPQPIRRPYPGLRPFERDEDELFFGREEQVDQLLDKLDATHFLAVLGTSGSGKSSLVRAGLLPALDSGFMGAAGACWAVADLRPGHEPFRRLATSLISSRSKLSVPASNDYILGTQKPPLDNNVHQPFKYDVFLSYSSIDKAKAEKLADRLSNDGLEVWLDKRIIKGGENIHERVIQGVQSSHFLVQMLSTNGLGSEWAKAEREIILSEDVNNRQKRFIPLLIAECKIPVELRRFKVIDYCNEQDKGYNELRDAITPRRENTQNPLDLEQASNADIKGQDIEKLEADLRKGSRALNWILGVQPLLPEGHRLLILVDQFEELFRHQREQQDDAAAFVSLLLGAATHPDVYVVITLRSEFLGNCALFPDLPEAINTGLFLTPWLTLEQMADAIQLPARLPQFQGEVDPELVQTLIADIRAETDKLPLLQHALMRLWHNARGQYYLCRDDLDRVGGLRECLNRHVEEAFSELDSRQKYIAEVLFRALTGYTSDGRETHRPLRLREIAALTGAEFAQVANAVEVFRRPEHGFLTPFSDINLEPDSIIDIAHEALIRQWRRLREWTADEAEQAELYLRLESAAQRHRKKEGALWIDPDLQIALQWRDEHRPTGLWAKRYGGDFKLAMDFLEASRKDREAQRQAEERHRKKEVTRARKIAVASLVALLLTAALAGWGWYERRKADEHARIAKTHQEQAEQAEREKTKNLFDSRLTHAALLARGEDYAGAREILRKTVALDTELPEDHLHRRHPRNLLAGYVEIMGGSADKLYQGAGAQLAGGVALSPDGRWLAAAGERGTLVLFDAESGRQLKKLEHHDSSAGEVGYVTATFDPDGETLYSLGEDESIVRWSLPDGEKVSNWEAPLQRWALAISPDGKRLASGGPDNKITLWSSETGEQLRTLEGHTGAIADGDSLDFSPDGKRLASASFDQTARIWDLETGKTLHTLQWHNDRVTAAAFSPDGNLVATGSYDKRVVLWDAKTGQLLRLFTGHDNIVFGVAFDAEGRRLLSAGRDHTMRLWDLATGVTLRVYQGHTAGLWNVARRGNTVYTAANDQTVRRWSPDTPEHWLWELPDEPISAAVAPDARFVTVGFRNGSLRAYRLPGAEATGRTGEPGPATTPGEPGGAASDNRHGSDPPILVAEIADAHGSGSINRIAFNPDGTILATAGMDGTAKIWQIDREANSLALTLRHTLEGHTDTVHAVAFSPDGLKLATAGYDGRVGLFDVETGDGEFFDAHNGKVGVVQFVEKGKMLMSAGEDFAARLWDLTKQPPESREVAKAQDMLLWASLRPDGKELAAVGRGESTLHDLDTAPAEPRRLVGHEQTVFRAIYGPDGRQLATVSGDMTVRLWDPEIAEELFALRLPTQQKHGVPLWDFDFRCTKAGDCWIAVPLTMGRLALYRLPYRHPPESIASARKEPRMDTNYDSLKFLFAQQVAPAVVVSYQKAGGRRLIPDN